MTEQQVLEEALKLSPQARCNIADALFDSVEEVDDLPVGPDIEAELDRIAKHSDEHPESLVAHEDVMRMAREVLHGGPYQP
jgi:hypothetical protein